MRGALPAVILVALAGCQDLTGIVVLVAPGDPNVHNVRLFIGTGTESTSSLTTSAHVQVDGASYWTRDVGNSADVVPVDGASELRFVFQTDAAIPVVIGVGYDAQMNPISAGLVHDLAPPSDPNQFIGYDLVLQAPVAMLGAQGQPLDLGLWSPDPATSSFEAACAGIVVAGESHPYFIVNDNDQDCDGLANDNPLECTPDVYLGTRPANPSEASCLVASVDPATTDSRCQLGGTPCTDNVPRGMTSCMASHVCTPSALCALCSNSFACAADYDGKGPGTIDGVAHYECPITRRPDGSLCEQTLALARPPTGGYNCTDFEIGNASSHQANQLDVDGLELDASIHDSPTSSCAGLLDVKGTPTLPTNDFTALVSFTLANKAGVAIPIHFASQVDTSCPPTADCTLEVDPFGDTELTACAAAWDAPVMISSPAASTTGESGPTLSADQLEMYFVASGTIYRTTRTAIGSPWNPAQIALMPATGGVYHRPELSPDGLQMLIGLTVPAATTDQLVITSRPPANGAWAPRSRCWSPTWAATSPRPRGRSGRVTRSCSAGKAPIPPISTTRRSTPRPTC